MNKLQTELLKIKTMRRKEALDYIWEYYKLPILGIVFGVIFLVSLISSIVKNSRLDPVVSVGLQSDLSFYYGEDFDRMILEAFPEDTGNTKPQVLNISSVANEKDPYGAVQITAYLASGDLDIVICDKETMEYLTADPELFSIEDISGSEIGNKASEIGISPLYCLTQKKCERQEAAVKLEEYLTSH